MRGRISPGRSGSSVAFGPFRLGGKNVGSESPHRRNAAVRAGEHSPARPRGRAATFGLDRDRGRAPVRAPSFRLGKAIRRWHPASIWLGLPWCDETPRRPAGAGVGQRMGVARPVRLAAASANGGPAAAPPRWLVTWRRLFPIAKSPLELRLAVQAGDPPAAEARLRWGSPPAGNGTAEPDHDRRGRPPLLPLRPPESPSRSRVRRSRQPGSSGISLPGASG